MVCTSQAYCMTSVKPDRTRHLYLKTEQKLDTCVSTDDMNKRTSTVIIWELNKISHVNRHTINPISMCGFVYCW